jgi:hypothetical protein
MATYQTNFSGYTVNVQPSDWTARWVTSNNTWAARAKAGAEGGQTLEQTSTVDARRLLSWDAIDVDADRDDVEILARFRTTSTTVDQLRLIARGSGAAAAEGAYFLGFAGSGDTLYLNKYVAGVSTAIGSGVAITYATNTWYWLRFRVNGTSLSGKFWQDGEDEPSAWTITGTDASIAAAGWVGVGVFESNGTKDFDYVSIGTNGDPAPLTNIAGGTSVRLSQASAESLTTSTTITARVTQEAVETLSTGNATARLSQIAVETISFPSTTTGTGPSMLIIAT